ncbi:hypothetical protein C0995_014026 [Termitomyces sp. Mi166|nr:hypothetical protein C0995_014026 [Termitomyces sp. Mi166\
MASPAFPPGLPPSPHVYYPDLYSLDNSRTVSNSNSTSGSFSDDTTFVTEDPNYSEHYHQYQSRIRIIDSPPLVHVPPFYHSPPGLHGPLSVDTSCIASPTMYHAYGYMQPVSPGNSKPKTRPRIHTGTSPRESPAASPQLLPVPPPATLPSKPLTVAEENKKRNFFPISWRVIGGGVLMGSESKASITEAGSPVIEFVNMHETPLKREDPQSKKIINISLPKPIKRTRSSSIPPTPTIHHVDTGTLL